jgi:hypothetical protein
MGDKAREALELRAILVSTRAALAHPPPGEQERIKTTATELLARLEQSVIRDGGHADMIAAIDAARRSLWEEADEVTGHMDNDGNQLTSEQRDHIRSIHRRANREVLPGEYQESSDLPHLRNDRMASLPPTERTKPPR